MIITLNEWDTKKNKPGDKTAIFTNQVVRVIEITDKGKPCPYCIVILSETSPVWIAGSFDEIVSRLQNA